MSNFSLGNKKYQYYETIRGGYEADHNFYGIDVIDTYMINSCLTDLKVQKWRFIVIE
ncbi:MAG: hypothetical protein ACQJCO_09075 [cyanobacterium endosymbiont of Rhopalodia sterrenbergii]